MTRPGAKGHPSQARATNQALLLQLVLHHGPQSRADLARASGLTPATASGVVGDLIADGLLSDGGRRVSASVGKPATLVYIADTSPLVACLDLSDHVTLRGALVTMAGEIVERRAVPRGGRQQAEAVELTLALAAELCSATDRRILAVACGTPGVVDSNGVVREAAHLRWQHEHLGAKLTAHTGLPAHVVNDADAATLAEYSFGGSTRQNLLLVRITDGVGAGLVIDGELFVGEHFAAGEIGHVTVTDSPDLGALCECGRRGCLEAEIAPSLLVDPSSPAGRASLTSVGRLLGITLSPVVSLLNLNEIVLSGDPDIVGGSCRDTLDETIRQRTMPAIAAELHVRLSALGDDAILLGMAGHALRAELGVVP